MKTRKLGKNGPAVGAIGLGCLSFGGLYGPADEKQSHATLSKALDLGVTHLDIANIYGAGVSEQVVGSFIKNNRHEFKIATKAGIKTTPRREFDNSGEYLSQCLEESFRRLNVDYVDLFYVHRRDPDIPIEEVTQSLVRLIDQGKIGGFGFSEIAPSSLERASKVHHVMAVQSEYSLWTRSPQLGMLQACERLGTAFVAFSPLARGMFADHFPDPAQMADRDFRAKQPRFMEPDFANNTAAIKKFATYANDNGWTPAALALAWALHQGDHIIPIPGTRTVEHFIQNTKAAEISLTAKHLKQIEEILPIGFAHGERYTKEQWVGVESYC